MVTKLLTTYANSFDPDEAGKTVKRGQILKKQLIFNKCFRNTVQEVSNSLDPDWSVLIEVHTVCKGNQQTKKVYASFQARVKC